MEAPFLGVCSGVLGPRRLFGDTGDVGELDDFDMVGVRGKLGMMNEGITGKEPWLGFPI